MGNSALKGDSPNLLRGGRKGHASLIPRGVDEMWKVNTSASLESLFGTTGVDAPPELRVVVCSETRVKVDAVASAVRTVVEGFEEGHRPDLEFVSVKADSCINAQPCGLTETLLGARNRIASGKLVLPPSRPGKAELVVAIESGLVQHATHWFDFAWVLVCAYDSEGRLVRETMAQSAWTPVPPRVVERVQAREGGMKHHTIGDDLEERFGGNAHDPHPVLTGGVVGREELLRQAVLVAVGRSLRPPKERDDDSEW